VLNRLLGVTPQGYELEADRKHRQKILDSLGLDSTSKALSVNGRVREVECSSSEVELVGAEATSFRAVAARVNYLAQDPAYTVRRKRGLQADGQANARELGEAQGVG
jgi:hypothetical protein